MKGAAPIPIVALVTHARHVPALERDRFAAAIHRELAGRALVLETCHRVEAYVVSADDAYHCPPTHVTYATYPTHVTDSTHVTYATHATLRPT